jgi:hypothetical protein
MPANGGRRSDAAERGVHGVGPRALERRVHEGRRRITAQHAHVAEDSLVERSELAALTVRRRALNERVRLHGAGHGGLDVRGQRGEMLLRGQASARDRQRQGPQLRVQRLDDRLDGRRGQRERVDVVGLGVKLDERSKNRRQKSC